MSPRILLPLLTGVFFDLDGTLVDSLPGIHFAIRQAFASCGRIAPGMDVRGLLGPPIDSIFRILAPDVSDVELRELVRAFRSCYDAEGWQLSVPYSGVPETVRSLKDDGLRLFVVTNKPEYATRKILERLGMIDLFEETVSRDSRSPAFASKAEMLRSLMAGHGLTPGTSLMVGDTGEDLAAAKEAGMRIAIMSYGYGGESLGAGEGVWARLGDFSQLREICGKEFHA
ncbi:MAG: HAD hydrolase-like protein [Bryobacterales bacterium]|nr:HAD hydrolase-like protein [Bryobacterales bacterium]